MVNLEANPLVQELFKLLRVGNWLGHGGNMFNLKMKPIYFPDTNSATGHCHSDALDVSNRTAVKFKDYIKTLHFTPPCQSVTFSICPTKKLSYCVWKAISCRSDWNVIWQWVLHHVSQQSISQFSQPIIFQSFPFRYVTQLLIWYKWTLQFICMGFGLRKHSENHEAGWRDNAK